MLLTESEIEDALRQVKAAFPNLSEWEYSNEIDEEYFGFTAWGCFVLPEDDDSLLQRRYYITFAIDQNQWRGTLTIGQHNYLWTSADVGDAHLLSTEPYANLAEAIAALKVKIADLAKAFSAI